MHRIDMGNTDYPPIDENISVVSISPPATEMFSFENEAETFAEYTRQVREKWIEFLFV